MTPAAASPSPAARACQLGGALAFFTSLTWFAFRYFVTFGRPAEGTARPADVLWNVALFTAFAAHHSVFARTPIRAWIARVAAPDLERSIYVWTASLLFAAVCGWWRPVAGVAWDVHGWPRVALHLLQAAGVALTLVSARALDIGDLAGVTRAGGRDDSGPPAFKTSGPYGWVRHPIYAGWFLVVLPAAPMTMTRLVFAVVSCAYLLVAIPIEEATMRRTSGRAYEKYAGQVKWRLLPGLY